MNDMTIAGVTVRRDAEGRFSLNDLHRAAGGDQKHQPGNWLRLQQTQDLAAEIESGAIPQIRGIESKQGLGTYVVKELVYAYAMWISAAFHLKVIRAYDAMATGQLAVPQDLPTALRLAADMAEQKAIAEQERDHAIATKAQIGSRREATAMAAASAATRRANQLADELGQSAKHATIIAVERATGSPSDTFDWRPLKKWCEKNGVTAVAVPCPRYGEAKAWPAAAWLAAYGIDLASIFAARKEAA